MTHVRIQVFPGGGGDVVDPGVEGRIPVAVLSDPAFDAGVVEPQGLTFGGAPVTKTGDGATHRIEDVNGDGRPDLLVFFSQRDLRVGRGPTALELGGRTRSGTRIAGRATVRPAAELRESARRRASPAKGGKPSAIPVPIDVLPGDPINDIEKSIPPALPVAVLSRPDFDAAAVVPETVLLSGSPVTGNPDGRLDEIRDVNGDGLRDLVIRVQGAPLRLVPGTNVLRLSGLTGDGRLASGEDRVHYSPLTTVTFHGGAEAMRGPVKADYPSNGAITLNDGTTATPYPSNILVAGATGVVSDIEITLVGLTHTYPDDLDILLVGPTGQSLVLMSDAGGVAPGVSGVDLIFDDDADGPLSGSVNPSTGRFQPTDLFIGATDAWPAPAPAPSGSTSLQAFDGTDPNGVWSLYVVDDTLQDIGTLSGWSITLVVASKYSSNDMVTIPAIGQAAPYPSTLAVSGLADVVVSKATVTLHGFTHTFPDDIAVLLVGPHGQTALLMWGVGGTGPWLGAADLTFDDHVLASLTDTSNPRTGTYRPSQALASTPGFAAPAPPGPYGLGLSNFLGSSPEGTWSLYVQDFFLGDQGSISGWDLTLTVMPSEARHNFAPITIPSGSPVVSQGPATPYPSAISTSGVPGIIGKVTVTLHGLTHTYADDLDILVEVNGLCVPLMSDAGGPFGMDHVDLTFDDDAATLPDENPLASGSYRPADYIGGDTDVFPFSCTGGFSDLRSLVELGNPFGTWSLYVDDDESGDVGSVAAGWSITFQSYITSRWYCNQNFPDYVFVPGGANTVGPADVYPSIATVGGIDRPVGRVEFFIEGSHGSPADLDLLLVGPDGTTGVEVMSDAAGTVTSDLVFGTVDSASEPIPQSATAFNALYRPTNYDGGDPFPAPAPLPSTASLAVFTESDPNGPWSLYAVDDTLGGRGYFNWCLRFTLLTGVPEVRNLRWSGTTGTQLEWEPADEALSYHLVRGEQAGLPNLTTADNDSCLRALTSATTAPDLTENPPVGGMYWYLVRGANSEGLGPAGFYRQNSQSLAREQNTSGNCPP